MKKIKFMLVVVAVMFSMSVSAQYSSTSSTAKRVVKKDTLVTNNTYSTSTGTWTIIINKKSGACYYYCKTRDGKLVKRYCPKEVSAEVSAKHGIKYTPRRTK